MRQLRVSNRSVAGGRGTRSVRADREPGATHFGSRDGPFRPGREFGEEHQTSPRHCQRFRDRKSLVPSRLSTRGRDMLMQPDDGCGKRRRSPPTFARIVGVHGMGRAISQKSKFGGKIFWEAGNGPNAGRGLGHAWAGGSKANGHEARGHPLSVKPKADTQGISVKRVTPRVASRRSVLSWLALVHEARNWALVSPLAATLEVGEMNARLRKPVSRRAPLAGFGFEGIPGRDGSKTAGRSSAGAAGGRAVCHCQFHMSTKARCCFPDRPAGSFGQHRGSGFFPSG